MKNDNKPYYSKNDLIKIMKDSAMAVNSLVSEYGQLEDYILEPNWK